MTVMQAQADMQASMQGEMQARQQYLHSEDEETIGDTIRRNADTNSKQLQELQAQNEMLKAETTALLKEISENKTASKKARRLNIAAFALSIVLPVASIIASILIAKFM